IVLLVLGLLSSLPGVLLFGYAIETARVVRSGASELPFWRPLRSKLVDGTLLTLVTVIWALPSTLLSFAAPASLHRPLPSLPGYSHSPIGSGMFHTLSALSFIWMVILAPLYPAIWGQFLGRGFLASFHVPQLTHRVISHLRVTLTLIGLQLVPALIVS